ncbi:MAG: TAXI family TRAP transporter solute-binding subunit [Desulfuromonadales bacterium]
MKTTKRLLSLLSAVALVVTLAIPCTALAAKTRLAFSGGPDGGTYQYFSNAISSRLSKNIPDVEVSNMASAGSVENLRRLNSGDADFGITYAGDLYLGANGKLTNDPKTYTNVYSMAYLYGAPAHLVVLEDGGINAVKDLEGKRIGVGPAGSGAAASAQRFFTSVGLWDKMKVEFIGYSEAASALGDKKLDAMWVFAGYPNSSIIQAAASNKIKLLSLVETAKASNFFKENPYYAELIIPAGTYSGVDYDVQSVQDSAIWTAGKHVADDIVYAALQDAYSDEGLAYMVSVTKAAKSMQIKDGVYGIATPVHPGAAKFWTEKGLTMTEDQKVK